MHGIATACRSVHADLAINGNARVESRATAHRFSQRADSKPLPLPDGGATFHFEAHAVFKRMLGKVLLSDQYVANMPRNCAMVHDLAQVPLTWVCSLGRRTTWLWMTGLAQMYPSGQSWNQLS